jgi:glycosyltransferase involved in cell wall biosynthesis
MSLPSTLGIVTISFNQARFLGECMQSVTLADRARLRHVIVDPGSTDGSRELISHNKHRFSAILFEPDKGPADGLNKGFAACDADIYGYLNSDDRFRPGALDWVLDYFDDHSATDVLLGAIALIDEHGRASPRKRTQDRPFDLRKYAVRACNVFQQGTFFRRQSFRRTPGFNLDRKTVWDGELVVDLALAGCRFDYTRRILGDFRIYPQSISGSRRFVNAERQDFEYLRAKVENAGIPPYSPLQASLIRLAHKFNPIRHASYFLAY